MKKASQVLLILSIVFAVLSIPVVLIIQFIFVPMWLEAISQISGVELQAMQDMLPLINVFAVVGTVISVIISIVIAALSLNALKKAKDKSELIVWGVLSIIFCNVIPGILILLIKNSELNNNVINNVN